MAMMSTGFAAIRSSAYDTVVSQAGHTSINDASVGRTFRSFVIPAMGQPAIDLYRASFRQVPPGSC